MITSTKFLLFALLLAFILATAVLVVPANQLLPPIYTLTDGTVYKQELAKFIEAGEVVKSHSVGNVPTSVDLLNVGSRLLALVTSMGDSSISIVDLSVGELSKFLLPDGAKPRVSVWCDIDNDGHSEVVVPLWGEGNSSVFVGELNEEFAIVDHTEYKVGTRPRSVVCADINGDGLKDVLSADNYSDTISVLENIGGSLVLNRTLDVSKEPGSLSINDFDGDGRNDIVVTHREADLASVLLQSSDGGFQRVLALATLKNPKDQIVADIDGDGDLDIATIDGGSNMVSIFYLEKLALKKVERIKVSGSPHAMKYIPSSQGVGAIVIASYPNWLEVLSNCSGQYKLDQSYWFGGLKKQKMLYLDFAANEPQHIYMVMAGTNQLVESTIRNMDCDL